MSIFANILSILIPGLMLMILLLKATDFAKKGGGKFGEMAMGAMKAVGGLAIGAATGGAALVGTGVIGRYAQSKASDETLKAKAASGDKTAQRKLALANSLATSSFDFRQTGLGKFAAKKSGMDFDKGAGFIGLGTDNTKGGRRAQVDHQKDEMMKKVKTYELSGSAALKQDQVAAGAKVQNERADQYEKDKAEAMKKGFVFNDKTEALFKRDYEKGDDMRKYGLNKQVESGSVEKILNAAETNKARRIKYAESLEKDHHKNAVVGAHTKAEGTVNAVKAIGKAWAKGIADNKAVAGVAATATALSGGVAAPAALAVVVTLGGLKALKNTLSHVHGTDSEVVASLKKGEDPLKKALAEISKNIAPQADAHAGPGDHAAVAKAVTAAAPHDNHGGGAQTPDNHGAAAHH